MSPAHFLWLSTGSTEMPRILALRLSNSPFRPAMVPSSVVQIGVKSFGWENNTAQPSPIHWWKFNVPSVVSAVKSGAVSLIRRLMGIAPLGELKCPSRGIGPPGSAIQNIHRDADPGARG